MVEKPVSPDDPQRPGNVPLPAGHTGAARDACSQGSSDFATFAEQIFDAFCEVEMSGRIIRWNQAFLQLTGYDAEEIGGFTYIELTPEKWHAFEEGIIRQQVLPRGYSDQYEKEYRRKDGSIAPIGLRAYLSRHPDGSPKSMWAIIRDISERKSAEKLLRDAAGRWQTTFDAVSNALVVFDLQQRVVQCNRSTMKHLNLPAEQILGRHCYELFHASSSPVSGCPFVTMQETGRSAEFEMQLEGRWFEVSAEPLRDDSGELVGAVHMMHDISERKVMFDGLRKTEALLSDTEHLAHIGSFQVDADTGGMFWSGGLYRIFETPEYAPPLNFEEICSMAHPADAGRLRRIVETLFSAGAGIVDDDFRVALRSGGQKHLRLIGQAIRDEKGQHCGASGTIMDVTLQMQLSDERHRDEDRLALLLEMTNMRNASEQELFELALEAVVFLSGSTAGCFHLYDEDLETITQIAWSAAVKGQCKTPESQHYPLERVGIWADSIRKRDVVIHNDYAAAPGSRGLPEGHFPVTRYVGLPVFDEGKRIVAAVSVANKETSYTEFDVRQVQLFMDDVWKVVLRSRAEARLAESEREFRNLFESSLDGVFRTGADGRIERANQAMARIAGLATPGELIGRAKIDFWENPLDRSVYLALLQEKGEIMHYPFRARTAAGKIREVEVTASLVRNDRGEPVATEGILRDVTEQRQLQEQLRQAQKMEAVGRLAGGIAHDFNNILSAILGFASLPLLGGKASDSERSTLQQIIALVDRAAALTKGLLAFSRCQAMTMKPIDLNRIVEAVMKLLRRLIGEDVTLIVRDATVPLPVQADAGQMEQVFMNLAINARDAMPDGGTLTVETERISLAGHEVEGLVPGDYALIRVSDTGTGIAPEDLCKVFDPFFTTKEAGKGTGLGLASVYGIMQQHGGAVRVQSTAGAGTTFLLYLPLSTAAPETLGENAAAPVAGGAETILLAEDDAVVRRVTKYILEMRGYTVLEAGNGAEAVAVCDAKKGKIDLFLSDVVMPELGGLEAWLVIRKQYPAMRIVFMSGYISDEGKLSLIGQLGHDCLMKPIEPRQLFAAVRRELDRD